MRSIRQGRLEAERWSVFLYWTLHSHSKQWPALRWFITRAGLWSLTFSACTLAWKTGLSLSINARQGDPFKIWNAYLTRSGGRGWAGREVAGTVALSLAGHQSCGQAGQVGLGFPMGTEMLWIWKQVTLCGNRISEGWLVLSAPQGTHFHSVLWTSESCRKHVVVSVYS